MTEAYMNMMQDNVLGITKGLYKTRMREDFDKRVKAYHDQDVQALAPYSYGEMAQKIYHAKHKIKFYKYVQEAFERNNAYIKEAIPASERKSGARYLMTQAMALHYTCERDDAVGEQAREIMVSIFGGNDMRRTRLTQPFTEPNGLQTFQSVCEIMVGSGKAADHKSYLKHAWNVRVKHGLGLPALAL